MLKLCRVTDPAKLFYLGTNEVLCCLERETARGL
jgi:hypothetical protein